MKTLPAFGLTVGLASCLLVGIAVAEFPPSLTSAEKPLGAWLNGVAGKSRAQIEADLGRPAEEGTWDFMGTKQPRLGYKTPAGATVAIYFFGGKALKVSYQLMSQ